VDVKIQGGCVPLCSPPDAYNCLIGLILLLYYNLFSIKYAIMTRLENFGRIQAAVLKKKIVLKYHACLTYTLNPPI